jgi:dTDP-4-dehydrorhamnose reductase
MRILIIGSNGMLGTQLSNSTAPNTHTIEIIKADREEIDITESSGVSRFIDAVSPDIIVNCAAYSNVDACETHISEAYAANSTGARNLASAGKQRGAKIIHISTDYVFDGTKKEPYRETDIPNPLSVYGKTKLAGELAIQETTDNYAIIRTAWLFGPYKGNFVTAIVDKGRSDRSVSVVTDQIGSPTYTKDLCRAIRTVISQNLRGLYHITNSGYCSRYEWAKAIFEITGEAVSVHPLKTADYRRPATVPANSSLECTKYTLATGQTMRPWREALKEYLTTRE